MLFQKIKSLDLIDRTTSPNKRKVNSENKKEKRNVAGYRARQLYKNISMLFLFPVKDGKLSTGINAAFNAPCYG